MSRRRKQAVMAMGAALVAVTVIVVFTVRFVLTPTITIRGRAVLLGAPPPPAVRNLSNLPPGAPAPADESLLVRADGGLANVFVYLEEDAAGSPGVVGEPVLVKQRQYNLHPRVLGVRVGQSVTFTPGRKPSPASSITRTSRSPGPTGRSPSRRSCVPASTRSSAWHEKLGMLEQRVVCLGPPETLLFSFDSK